MKAFLLKYRSSLLLFAVMFLFGWGSAAVVAERQSDKADRGDDAHRGGSR